jgi:uroporphyrinogen decarboxylase
VFESWGGELSPVEFATFAMPYLKDIVKRTRQSLIAINPEYASVPIAVFARGSHYALEDLADSEYDIMSLDWTMDPALARKRTANKVTLQGNADPSLLYGDRDTIFANVDRMLRGFGTQSRYIANLGHGMYPGTFISSLFFYPLQNCCY